MRKDRERTNTARRKKKQQEIRQSLSIKHECFLTIIHGYNMREDRKRSGRQKKDRRNSQKERRKRTERINSHTKADKAEKQENKEGSSVEKGVEVFSDISSRLVFHWIEGES